jgi:hypothetical protein
MLGSRSFASSSARFEFDAVYSSVEVGVKIIGSEPGESELPEAVTSSTLFACLTFDWLLNK